MKKIWKKLLSAFVLVPSLLLFTACSEPPPPPGGGDGDGSGGGNGGGGEQNPSTTLTDAEQNTAYGKLKARTTDFINGTTNTVTIIGTKDVNTNIDLAPTNDFEEEVATSINTLLNDEEGKRSSDKKVDIGYNLTDGTGYKVVKDFNIAADDNYYVSAEEYTVKNSSAHKTYINEREIDDLGNESDKKFAYNVCDQYSRNNYQISFVDDVVILDIVDDSATYADYKSNVVDLLDKYGVKVANKNDIVVNNEMTLNNGVYTLQSVITSDDATMRQGGLNMTTDIEGIITYTFTDTEIKNLKVETRVEGTTTMDLPAGTVKNDEDVEAPLEVSMTTVENYGLTETFNNSNISADYTSYEEMGNIFADVEFYLDGYLVGTNGGVYGGTIHYHNLESYTNATIDSWYLDEDCTVSADSLTTLPSYTLKLYAKTTAIETGYAKVVVKEVRDDEDNVEVKAFNFVDVTENAGIYDVAGLLNQDLVGDGLATENKWTYYITVNGNDFVVGENECVLEDQGVYYIEINYTSPVESVE